jgi:hypothetical protein
LDKEVPAEKEDAVDHMRLGRAIMTHGLSRSKVEIAPEVGFISLRQPGRMD